jgi:hypothetical protein
MLQDLPEGMGQEQYDAINARMDVENDPPDGLIFHSAGEGPTGRWRIVDVWESRQHYQRFFEERLGPAITEVSGQEPGQGEAPDTTWWSVHSVINP